MKTREQLFAGTHLEHWTAVHNGSPQAGGLVPFVTAAEVQAMAAAIVAGGVPVDFETKLQMLGNGGILHRNIEKNCRRFICLLLAEREGLFHGLKPAQREKLLSVLAYVRKDDDAIADYRPDGYIDDQMQVRAAMLELAPVLNQFNSWRLRHQVPDLWRFTFSEHTHTTYVLRN